MARTIFVLSVAAAATAVALAGSHVPQFPSVRALVHRTCAISHPPNTYGYSLAPVSYKYSAGTVRSSVSGFADLKMENVDAEKLRYEFLQVLRSRRTAEDMNFFKFYAVSQLPKRYEFLQVLHSRRTAGVPLSVEPGKPVTHPLYQEVPRPTYSEEMESCPKANIPNLKELLKEENFYLTTEAGEQGRLPVLVLSLKESKERKRPAVVFLHSTNKCKEWLRPLLEAYASRGYVAIAIDSRYHGERARNLTTYRDALVRSWKEGDTMPFIFDTVWDLVKLADYLTQREDIDPSRIGITGESLGGMHAWFAASLDTRYAVVVPIIGVQGFRWAIEHNKWQARVDSIRAVFEEARIDLGKSVIDKEVVEKVWDRIAPGLASKFDSPHTIPIIAPRPLLILNGNEDPRCPLPGLEVPKSRVCKAYEETHSLHKFKLIDEPGIGHRMTSPMVKEASDWFDKFL